MNIFRYIFFVTFIVVEFGTAPIHAFGMPNGFIDDILSFINSLGESVKGMLSFIKSNSGKADEMDIGYILFNPRYQQMPYYLKRTKESLNSSGFDPSLETKIFLHGYLFPLDFPNDIKFKTKDKMFVIGKYNVIVVNYTQYARGMLTTAIKKGYIVAQNIADTINFLMENTGIESTKFHLIGHSMGGNVAGYVGTLIPNLGRITGLDPSGPVYENMPPEYRLTYKSANFVDSIHTNGAKVFIEGEGIYFPMSHQDFYPNNGAQQPGCGVGDTFQPENLKNETILEPLQSVICYHQRSEFLFMESVTSQDCKFIGLSCSSYDDFKSGKCTPENSRTAEMGFHAKPLPGIPVETKFYLDTSSKPPYCKPLKEN